VTTGDGRRVLLVKMSSLGDVVHALPAVSDALEHGFRFHWVVEEAFASVPARHPGVSRVLPIAWRRWRTNLRANRAELEAFWRELRSESYDMALDAQGLLKSAAVMLGARAEQKAGFDFRSAREPLAALTYGRRLAVPQGAHAVDRLRSLFAAALDYPRPAGTAVFGLERSEHAAPRRCVLLHGTTWASKHWPEPMWRVLAGHLSGAGWAVEIPWGNPAERGRAERIAAGRSGITVLERAPLDVLGERIADAGLVIGVDSGLSHLAGACGVPTVVIYGSTSAARTGARGRRVLNLEATFDCAPCLARECGYRGPAQSFNDEVIQPACYARLTPERVFEEAMALLERRGTD
jgi:heptosyltransferase-1